MTDKEIIIQMERELGVPINVEYNKFGDVEHLNLSSNKIEKLPDIISKLINLETIDLSNNKLVECENVFNIKGLREINLSKNEFVKFPVIKEKHSVEILNFSKNKIESLNKTIELLTELNDLNLSHNEIVGFPEEVIYLEKLVTLMISYNKLTFIPEGLGSMRTLAYLTLDNNNISELPPSFGRLTQLWGLDVSNNPIIHIPEALGHMLKLGILRIKQTKVEKLPDAIKDDVDINFVFLLESIREKIPQEKYILGSDWIKANKTIIAFWKKEWKTQEYRTTWHIRNILDSVEKKVSSESLVNFMVGCNDIDSGFLQEKYLLTEEQRELYPLWFIEFPLNLSHGEKFLKIRLNNLVKHEDEFIGYPSKNKENNKIIKRVKIEIETPGYKKYNFDHIFTPNTEVESIALSKDPDHTWLTDIVYFPIENQSKILENYNITYNVTLFFDEEGSDVHMTTNQRFIIPILRKNNIQNMEKLINKYPAILALFISLISMITSLLSSFGLIASIFESISDQIWGFLITFLVVTTVVSILVLFRSKNDDYIIDKVQPDP